MVVRVRPRAGAIRFSPLATSSSLPTNSTTGRRSEGLKSAVRAASPRGVDVARSAQDLAKWCVQLQATLAQKDVKYDRSAALGLLRQLCSLSATDLTDYDTARQLAWAFKTIYSELAESDAKPANHAEIEARIKALDEELKLTLPSGQGHQILDELPAALRKLNDFDPAKVQQIFQELAKLLSSK